MHVPNKKQFNKKKLINTVPIYFLFYNIIQKKIIYFQKS